MSGVEFIIFFSFVLALLLAPLPFLIHTIKEDERKHEKHLARRRKSIKTI